MIKKVSLITLLLFLPFSLSAETIILKSGKTIEAPIIEKNDKSIKVEIRGVSITYYSDEIESIDGEKIKIETPSAISTDKTEKTSQQILEDISPGVVVITNQESGENKVAGSGFIIDKKGVIVTCLHVLVGAMDMNLSVKLKDGRLFPIQGIVAYDASRDICLVKIDADDLPTISLGDADSLIQGEKTFAVSAHRGFGYSISEGSFDRKITAYSRKYIQVTTPLTTGNSGGPVNNINGEVIGIVSRGNEKVNIYLAIPIDEEMEYFIDSSQKKATKETMEKILNDFKTVNNFFVTGLRYEKKGNPEQALRYYKKVLDYNIMVPQYYEGIASLYGAHLKDYDQEIFYAKKALEIDPTSDLAPEFLLLGYETKMLKLIANNDYKGAENTFHQFLEDIELIQSFNPDMAHTIWESFSQGESGQLIRKKLSL